MGTRDVPRCETLRPPAGASHPRRTETQPRRWPPEALQEQDGWRVKLRGSRVRRGVMELFGPWPATEVVRETMPIPNPNPFHRQRLLDQQ